MKKLIVISTFIFILNNIMGYEIFYNENSQNNLKGIENKLKTIKENVKNKKKAKKYSINDSFENVNNNITSKFGKEKIEINKDKKTIILLGKQRSKNGLKKNNVNYLKYENKANNFLKKMINLELMEDENIQLLKIKKDISGVQKRKAENEIENEIEPQIHSLTYCFGRTYLGKPIFNSLLNIEYDLITEEIIFFKAKNWMKFSADELNITPSMSNELKIKEKINNKINNSLYNKNIKIKSVEIEEIILGWIINDEGELIPALIHLDSYTTENKETDFRCSGMEKI